MGTIPRVVHVSSLEGKRTVLGNPVPWIFSSL